MKTLILAVAMMISAPSFAASGPSGLAYAAEKKKCDDDKGDFEEKIVGNTLCVNDKAFKIPSNYQDADKVEIYKDGRPTGEKQILEVYCFNKNFRDLRCRKFTKDTTSIRAKLAKSGNAQVSGVTIDGKFYPACSKAAENTDGDSWGWENNKTCKFI